MADKPRIAVVGSSNTDMVVKCARIPQVGETVTGGQFFMVPGGKGANQAVAAARLGAEVIFVARVGNDMFGHEAIEGYKRENIIVDHIQHDPETHTGVALIMVDEQGENLIAVASGANHRLNTSDVDRAWDAIAGCQVLLLQLEIPIDVVFYAARRAAEAGLTVILDPAPAAQLPAELLRRVSIITPNESEAAQLTDLSVDNLAEAERAASALLSRGVGCAIVTLGSQGAFVANREEMFHLPAFQVDAVDSTAAGDAFNGALAVAIAEGQPLQQAVRWAALAGAYSATKMGAQPSLPNRQQLEEFAKSFQ